MSARRSFPPLPESGSWTIVSVVLALGWASVYAFVGLASGRPEIAILAGACAGVAVVLLLALTLPAVPFLPALAVALPMPALYSSETLRVGFPVLFTAMVVAAWALRHGPSLRQLPAARLPWRTGALWMSVVLASTLFGSDPFGGAREVVSLGLLLCLLVVAVQELSRRPAGRTSLAAILGWVAGGWGFVAVLQAIRLVPTSLPARGDSLQRATLGLEWPNEAGMLMAVLLPFAAWNLARAEGTRARLAGTICCALAVLGLAATFSRGSWLAAMFAPLVLLLAGRGRSVVRIWAMGGAAVLLLDLVTGGALSTRVLETLRDPLVGQRAYLMLIGLRMFVDHPVLGLGPGGFAGNLDSYGPQLGGLWDYVGSAHNTYIQVAAENGALGLAAFLMFLAVVARLLVRSSRRAHRRSDLAPVALWSFATFCLVGMVEWSLAQGVGQAAVLAMAIGLTEGHDGPEIVSGRPMRSGGWHGPNGGATESS